MIEPIYSIAYTHQLQRQITDQTQLSMQSQTSDTLTNVTDITRHGVGGVLMSPYRTITSKSNTRNTSLMNTPRNKRVTSASSNVSSAWM